MNISLVFSGGKPCCNKKSSNNTVSCKFNHVAVETDREISGELTDKNSEGFPKVHKCNAEGYKCTNSTNKWWKFWEKESSKNCPCKQDYTVKLLLEDN